MNTEVQALAAAGTLSSEVRAQFVDFAGTVVSVADGIACGFVAISVCQVKLVIAVIRLVARLFAEWFADVNHD